MESVTRQTTFDLDDGTGDYLEVEVSLTETYGEVGAKIEGATRIHRHHCSLRQLHTIRTDWDLLGPELAAYHDHIIADAESHFADAGAEIRAEEAEAHASQEADSAIAFQKEHREAS